MIVGVIFAVIAVYLVISTILGLLIWVAIIAVPALAIVAAIKLTHRSGAKTVKRERVTSRPVKGIVDCVGEQLSIGDTVRAGTGFDGPMELAFSRGVIVEVGRGKAGGSSRPVAASARRRRRPLFGAARGGGGLACPGRSTVRGGGSAPRGGA
jgi:hypothetical protein